ncbi:MAG: HAMP domain-containing sensor histidine kinase [Candidatus Woesearchaeota archaeon]
MPVLISIGSVFIVVGLLGLHSKTLSSLHELHQATEKLEKGDFSVRTEIKTGDELEYLGNTLNKAISELEKTDEKRKQLDKAKTEFLSITSHELRSPMTPMRAQLQMLLGDYFGRLNKKQKESVKIVLRNTERLDRIIQDFLEIARIEAARLKFKFVKTDLTEHISRLVEEMDGFLPEKEIKIVLKIDKLPVFEVDPDRVMQVLRNLINNAKKFSTKNKKIFVDVGLQNNHVLFNVKDQGIGLSPENQRRIFEPFFQAEQTIYREKGGTGLGLAICHGIIESQNGRLWVESELGKGAVFNFTVPLQPVKESKPIRLLFSEQEDVEERIKELFVEYLGPLGEQEFEMLNKTGLKYEALVEYTQELEKKRIIKDTAAEQMINEINSLFNIKKIINLPQEIRKTYVNLLGSSGEKRFDEFGELTSNKVIRDVNELEEKRELNAKEASKFRDLVMGLFRQKSLKEEKEITDREEPSRAIGTEELLKAGLIKPKKVRKNSNKKR